MGALEAPQDKYGQEHRTGTSRAEQTDKDHGGAGSSGGHGRWSSGALASVLSARPLQPELLYPPQKNFPGEVRGYQETSGAKHTT